MSHATGIEATPELLDKFSTMKDDKTRLVKVGIENEQLVLLKSCNVHGNWQDDYEKYVTPLIEGTNPCYILFRMDTKNNLGYEWLFITWSPDRAEIRPKMLYAATRATLKTGFGGGRIIDELFANDMADVTLQGYHKHKEAKEAPPPLTLAEEELELVRKHETDTAKSVDSKNQTVPGINFPISDQVQDKLLQLDSGAFNYIKLMINIAQETIELEESDDIHITNLPAKVPDDHARYHLLRFSHSHEGDYLHSLVFIYTMPGYKCPVKERMLYSTCKAPLTQFIEELLGKEIEKKIEVDNGAELTEQFIYDEVHPKKNIVKQAFSKPKGPAGRGPKRVTKHPVDKT